MKKIVGVVIIGLLVVMLLLVARAHQDTGLQENSVYESRLFVIGLFRIDLHAYEITGCVSLGYTMVSFLCFKRSTSTMMGPILIGGLPPLVLTLRYNPALRQ